MSGQIVSLGSLSLGQCVPLAVTAEGAITASVNVSLPQIQAQIAGLLQAQINLSVNPPTLAASLSTALQIVTSLEAAIAVGLPSVDFQVTAVAALLAKLQVTLGSLTAQLGISANLGLILGSPGVAAYAYSGTVGDLGPAVTTATAGGLPIGSGPGDACNAILLATETPATWSAMQQLFKTS